MVLPPSSLPTIPLLPSSVYLSLANLSEEKKKEQIDMLFLAKGNTKVLTCATSLCWRFFAARR